jgi:energy-coupling factor transporter ATP-binding protein EcfA2
LTGAARQLPPSADIPSEGCVIGTATYPGSERPVAITVADRKLHLEIVGPTGSGKTALLTSLISADMHAGRGVVVIEPKDLVTECLKRVPQDRIKDVIVLDPSDDEQPVGLNLLDTSEAPAELVAENVVHVFLQLFGSSLLGPRSEDLLRAALLTGMSNSDFTLVDVGLLLTDANWRRPFVEAVSHDTVGLAQFWAAFEALKPNDQAQVIAPLQNKLRQTVLRSRVRYCIGQSDSKLKLRAALDSGKLLFVPLRKGILGDTTASLMGSLVVARIWQTIQARAAVAVADRRQVHLYIDEAADYMHLPTSIGDMLAQARSLGLGVTVAMQHTGQLLPELKQDLEVNCRSKILFQLNARDARAFEAELRPYATAEDLQGLGRFEVIAQLAVGQRVAPPVTAVTLPPPPETHREKSAIAWSRQHYGRSRSDIEADMQRRHQVAAPKTNVGRRRAREGGT